MRHTYLGQYQNFCCVAGDCPDNCCKKWAIEIDDEALKRYQSLSLQEVDYEEGIFRQKSNGDCAFLKENGLCDLYIRHGEESLCQTCTMYPRHMEEFPQVREYSLSISCPEVAKDYLDVTKDVTAMRSCETDETDTEEYEDFDDIVYDILKTGREEMFEAVCDGDISFCEKTMWVLFLADFMQDEIDGGNLEEIWEKWKQQREQAEEAVRSGRERIQSRQFAEGVLELFVQLEPLDISFRKLVQKTRQYCKEMSKQEWECVRQKFAQKHPKYEKILARLLHYFLYTYFCGSIYDEYIYGMASVAVYSPYIIYWIWLYLDAEDIEYSMEEMIYRYSRELEHCNENMILFEQLCEENRL